MIVALSIAAVAATTACSHEPEAAPSAPPRESTPSFAPPSGDVWPYETPSLSPDAERDDDAGACAVAEYLMDAISYDAVRGRHDALDRYSLPECPTCQEFSDSIDDEVRNGGWTRGDYSTITGRSILGPQDGDDASIVYCVFDADVAEAQVWDGVSDAVTYYGEGTARFVFQMQRTERGWRVKDWSSRTDREIS
ncbi:hypothetical protein H8R18_07830 [Nanchangia anserum]|uniref:DUF6318 domain-containing protein n=1 Tax=Nanchangia anserum TaxID=2692125 RepID=A0A8I0G7R7_9ACTO|nr:DUF6318 family protein [Nanchangia anserum]MBD3689430.1 hypothetical protein [Nanchangia anserum]QOX81634.1 hypothetical protein H8R18_07830 [Nanchangia anserum]